MSTLTEEGVSRVKQVRADFVLCCTVGRMLQFLGAELVVVLGVRQVACDGC